MQGVGLSLHGSIPSLDELSMKTGFWAEEEKMDPSYKARLVTIPSRLLQQDGKHFGDFSVSFESEGLLALTKVLSFRFKK